MVNVAVINLRTIIKYLVLVLILILIITVTRFFLNKENNINLKITNISLTGCLDTTLPDIEGKNIKKRLEQEQVSTRSSTLKRMLDTELKVMNSLIVDGEEDEVIEKIVENENNVQNQNENTTNNVQLADTNVATQEITENNIAAKYNTTYGTVKIKNESDKQITTDMLTPNISLENNKDIVIFHTHTCESYTPSEKFSYEMTGTYRTTDLNYSVARVGTELQTQLQQYGFNVIHDQTYHDYPAYSGSYGRSLKTVESVLTNTTAQVVIDLHRDAVGSKPDYAPSVKIGDEKVAQLMFVMGTDGGGLQHLNWQQNLKFAVKVQEKANELYPGLFRPIIVRNSRYNQHLTKAACIIEVGATGNTLDECLASMKYLSKILSEVMK